MSLPFQPAALGGEMRGGARTRPARQEMRLAFTFLPPAAPSLTLKFLAGLYERGPPPVPGRFTVGDYSLQIATRLKLDFIAAVSPRRPAGIRPGEVLVLAFTKRIFVANDFPSAPSMQLRFVAGSYGTATAPGGTPPRHLQTPPAYSIATAVPFSADTRLGSLILSEAAL